MIKNGSQGVKPERPSDIGMQEGRGIKGLAVAYVVLFLLTCVSSPAQELPFTHYTQDNEVNPLPSADVRSLYQDRLGFIWMVIYSSGILRYDGHKLETYSIADGLPDLTVRQVLEDPLGRLWVGSNAGLAVSDKPLSEYSGNERIHFRSKIGSTELLKTTIIQNRMAVDARGWLWVGTREDGIVRYRFEGLDSVIADVVRTDIYGDGKNKDVRSIVVRRDGSVWAGIGTGDLLVFTTDSPKFDLLTAKDGAPRLSTDALYETSAGRLIGGCIDGSLWQLVDELPERRVEVFSNELKSLINSIIEAPEGTIWVASDASGVMRFAATADRSPRSGGISGSNLLTKKNGFLSDNVSNILRDREGNIWFAQLGGISKLRPSYAAFLNFTAKSHAGEKPALPNPAVNSVVPSAAGTTPMGIWVGTSGGGLALIRDDGEVEALQTEHGLRDNTVNALVRDEKGRIWTGTASGINCLSFDPTNPPPEARHSRSVTLGNRKGTISSYRFTTIYSAKSFPLQLGDGTGTTLESLWLPGYKSLYCFAGDEWFIFRSSSGLPATYYHAVAFDDVGRLWVGTRDGGLYRSKFPLNLMMLRQMEARDTEFDEGRGGKFGREIIAPIFEPQWSRSTGAPSNQIETMIWREGALWVGTPEGLAIVEGDPPKMVVHLTMEDGLRANNVTSMAFSPLRGSVWVGTNGGLSEIETKTRKLLRNITKQDGLVDNEVWFYGSVTIGRDGTIYFGTARGLSLYKPHLDMTNKVIPLLRLRQASLREDRSGNNEILLEYAALSFSNEKLVRYKTRLVGYDEDWSSAESDVRLRYTNLPAFFFPKRYTFEVLASNNDNVWTETPFTYSFSVQPPWWFRWWSLVSNALLLGGLVYTYSRYRTRQLERRSRQLEKTVEDRTEEIRQKAEKIRSQAELLTTQNKELEEKNEEIIRTQEQLVMQEKLASLGSLTAAIAHEIKNPLNFVNNFADLSKDLTQILQQDIAKQRERLDPESVTNIEDLITDLDHNVKKIAEHGKRADSIVRGMLLHSSGKTGERLPTDINILLDEYVHLAYHGMRAQDSNFNVSIKTDYDRSIGEVEAVPQDLSRAFLNIVNNACYAAYEKKKKTKEPFTPTVSVCTKNLGEKVEIRIRDNGHGVPKDIVDKIFNPFFTTKPTGKGTGLGLSLSYDVIVKEHKGELTVETEQGSYAEFIIRLPNTKKPTEE